MKKQILILGKALSKAEQKNVFGGATLTHAPVDDSNPGCGPDFPCSFMSTGGGNHRFGVCAADGYCY